MKSKLAAFFEDDETSFPQKQVDDQKLTKYAHGMTKKTRREKEKEAQDAKNKEEEDLTAKAYDEFIQTFEGESVTARAQSGPGFVKSGNSESSTYAPNIRGRGATNSRAFRPERSPSPTAKPKGKRAMDKFLEEIKRDQAEREQRLNRPSRAQGRSVTALAAYESQSGSRDRGDPETSNLFMANLPSTVSEPSLGNFCAKFGPVASVKIMWPRTDGSAGPGADMTQARRVKNSGLSGFVSFMKRKDAEVAIRELDGFEWADHVLRVGWSKAVPLGPKAQFGVTSSWWAGKVAPEMETFVRMVAALVHEHGVEFEDNLKEKESSNPKYSFLFDSQSAEQRLYSSILRSVDPPEPSFWDDGYNSVYSSDSAEDSERERGPRDKLGRLARRRFESMLRALTGRRGDIARCMVFSLEHAEAASEVSDIIISSMLIDNTPVPRKVARLHLVCDILHNSAASVPNAWKFRQDFQLRLGLVFDHLSTIYHSFPGRITAETFKTQITAVVDVWEDSIVFPPDFTTELRVRLEGRQDVSQEETVDADATQAAQETSAESRFKSSSFQPAASADAKSENGSVEMEIEDDDQSRQIADDDVDGAPMDDDVDGEPMDDVDGQPLQDDLDGEPMDDDLDGVPM